MHRLLEKGGAWVEALRRWVQWNTLNGDRVTWGSGDVLQPMMTMRKLEDAAAHAAEAHVTEIKASLGLALFSLRSLILALEQNNETAYAAHAKEVLRHLEDTDART